MSEQSLQTSNRKDQHIDICLHEQVTSKGITTGFERYRFVHNALPEIGFQDIDMTVEFCNKKVKPFLMSSMTGGTERAKKINLNLAQTAEAQRWSLGLGSGRAALERKALAETYQVRNAAPTIPVVANLGAVQLNYGCSADDCARLVRLLEADALVLHLNSIQEIFQDEGDTDFRSLIQQISKVCASLTVPVGVKEVGWGLNADVADKLITAGVSFLDVAGAGGTSWSQVEKLRSVDPIRQKAAEAFLDWGISTSDCIISIRAENTSSKLIASGGMQNGMDAAKAMALGADLAGFGRVFLERAVESPESVAELCKQTEFELQAAMFGIGAKKITDLQYNTSLKRVTF